MIIRVYHCQVSNNFVTVSYVYCVGVNELFMCENSKNTFKDDLRFY